MPFHFPWPSVVNFSLVAIISGVIWVKMHFMRMEIHSLIQKLPQLGSDFVLQELYAIRRDLEAIKDRQALYELKKGVLDEE